MRRMHPNYWQITIIMCTIGAKDYAMVSTVTQCATSLWQYTPCNTHVPQASMHKAKKIIALIHVNNNNKN